MKDSCSDFVKNNCSYFTKIDNTNINSTTNPKLEKEVVK